MSLCEKGCNKLLLTLESRALICMVPHWNGIQGHTLTSQSTTIIFVSSLSCHKALYGGCWTCSLFETGDKIILWNFNPLLYSYPFTFMSQSFVWRLLDMFPVWNGIPGHTVKCQSTTILLSSHSHVTTLYMGILGNVPCLKRDTMSYCENYILIVSLSCHTALYGYSWICSLFETGYTVIVRNVAGALARGRDFQGFEGLRPHQLRRGRRVP